MCVGRAGVDDDVFDHVSDGADLPRDRLRSHRSIFFLDEPADVVPVLPAAPAEHQGMLGDDEVVEPVAAQIDVARATLGPDTRTRIAQRRVVVVNLVVDQPEVAGMPDVERFVVKPRELTFHDEIGVGVGRLDPILTAADHTQTAQNGSRAQVNQNTGHVTAADLQTVEDEVAPGDPQDGTGVSGHQRRIRRLAPVPVDDDRFSFVRVEANRLGR